MTDTRVLFHSDYMEVRPSKGKEQHVYFASVADMDMDGDKIFISFHDVNRRGVNLHIGADNILRFCQEVRRARKK